MRAFFALEFPKVMKQELYDHIQSLKKIYPDLKWIKKDALHLTLKFLGDVPQQKITEISSTCLSLFKQTDTFSISTTHCGFFPNSNKARVFFLDIGYSQPLAEIFRLLGDKLSNWGFEPEKRKFHPHITLARIKNNPPEEVVKTLNNYNIQPFSFPVNKITLMQSHLSPSGARYTPVQKFSLRTT